MNPFEQLLKELGLILDLNLKPDLHQACLLEFEDGITIQIEHEESLNKLLLGSQIGKLNAGPYREKILKQALIANGELVFGKGVFAYSEKNNTLVLFSYLPFISLNGQLLAQFLEIFLAEARLWTQALSRGDIPQLEPEATSGGFFGLKP